jgi:hypothetical protein
VGDTKIKKHKIDEEKRMFNLKWEEAYFCANNVVNHSA